jgi:uncharacterized protein involved in exopolysaccharide biosynthesis
MLQNYPTQQPSFYEDSAASAQSLDIPYLLSIVRRRILYFVIPYLFVVMAGFAIIEMQRPIYRAEGEILVESPTIPSDLVHPTITEFADERYEVFKQRIMARDNLLGVIEKYDLFPRDRQSAPESEILELMRTRVALAPVNLDLKRPGTTTTAFTVAFEYETPDLALKVTDDFIAGILNQDSNRRTNNATDTTHFVEQEVNRLTGEREAVVAHLEALKRSAPDQAETLSEAVKAQTKSLADLETELVQKSSIYSDEHPAMKALKKKIAALKRIIAAGPGLTPVAEGDKSVVGMQVLEQQALDLGKNLEDANRKLAAARLGESMERNKQAEHLQLIETPELPYKPVRPKKLKLFAIALAVAGLFGAGSVFAAEMLDRSVRRSSDLAAIVDKHLIVSIPYLSTPGEERQKRRNIILLCTALVAILAGAIAVPVMKGVSIDFDRSWIGGVTRLFQ